MEAKILAVWEGFKAVSRLEIRNGGRKVANKLAIYIDNLEGQRLIAAIMKEPRGSSLLESLSLNLPRIREYVRSIREEASKYTSVTFSWTRAHTTSNSFITLGNSEADKLAKEGLSVALSNDYYSINILFFVRLCLYLLFSLRRLNDLNRENLIRR